MKTEKDLPYVLEDEFRGPNDLGISREFGEENNSSDVYEWNLVSSQKFELLIIGNYLIENADEEYFMIREWDNDEIIKVARIKYTKPEYVSIKPYDCGKEELILTKEEKQILNDFFKKEFNGKPIWKHFLWRTRDALEGFTETYLTEDIEQPNYLELPDE